MDGSEKDPSCDCGLFYTLSPREARANTGLFVHLYVRLLAARTWWVAESSFWLFCEFCEHPLDRITNIVYNGYVNVHRD